MAGALIGAVLGMALGVGSKVLLGGVAGVNDLWPAAIVGLLAGLAMRVVSDTGRSSVLRGALAAATAVGGVILGDIATANYIQGQGPKARVADVESEPAEDEPTEEGEAAAAAPVETTKMPEENPSIGLARPQRQTDDVQTMIWLGLAALVAYGLGQGSNSAATSNEPTTSDMGPSSTPTVDPAD
jgi:hypothetical protein